jgi:hypothetical protein
MACFLPSYLAGAVIGAVRVRPETRKSSDSPKGVGVTPSLEFNCPISLNYPLVPRHGDAYSNPLSINPSEEAI